MTIEEMDEAYSNLKIEYFDIQDKLTTAEQYIDCYKKDILKLKKQLEIAVNGLELYKNLRGDGTLKNYESIAKQALKEIKELEK